MLQVLNIWISCMGHPTREICRCNSYAFSAWFPSEQNFYFVLNKVDLCSLMVNPIGHSQLNAVMARFSHIYGDNGVDRPIILPSCQ